jgi:hypothetical protein
LAIALTEVFVLGPQPGKRRTLFAPKPIERNIANVLLAGECARLFSSIPLPEKSGYRCFFAMSNRELQKLLIHTNPDIVLSLNTRNRLFEMMTLLRRLSVNMFHMLPVEKGCWWLPVLRDGKDWLGMCALRAGEFSEVFAEIVRSTRLARAEGTELTGLKNQYLEPAPMQCRIPHLRTGDYDWDNSDRTHSSASSTSEYGTKLQFGCALPVIRREMLLSTFLS